MELEHTDENVKLIFNRLLYKWEEDLQVQDANFIGSVYRYYMLFGLVTPLQFEGLMINYNKYYKEEEENEDNSCW